MSKLHTGKIETEEKRPVGDAAALSRRQLLGLAGATSAGVIAACGEEGPREVRGGMADLAKPADMAGTSGTSDLATPPCMPKIATGAETLGVNQVKRFYNSTVKEQSFFVARDSKGFYALNDVCSHNQCQANFNTGALTFDCPCHGSRFNFDGTILTGPAPTPLKVFPMKRLTGGQLEVDVCKYTTDRTGRVT